MEKLKIDYIKVSEIAPYKRNAKLHPAEQIEQIIRSISEFGFNDPIAIDEHNVIIEGHGRLLAIKEMQKRGIFGDEVPVIYLRGLSEEQKKAYILAHNKLTMNTDFDLEMLQAELDDITMFDMSDFGFGEDNTGVEELGKVREDNYDEPLPVVPKSKLGEIYRLGDHILMCGDSTNVNDVLKLMDGEKASLCVTDPPYNVAVTNSKGMTIKNDDMNESKFVDFLTSAFKNMKDNLNPGGAFYVWLEDTHRRSFEQTLVNVGLQIRSVIVWVKNAASFGRSDYHWMHESCLYGWNDGAAHYFVEDFTQTTVIEDKPDISKMSKDEMRKELEFFYSEDYPKTVIHEKKPTVNDLHPTMKPLKLLERLIRNSSSVGDIVLDLFGGSGSTLMVCEQMGRKCRMMEYDPIYVDVIIDRWESYTGSKAELIKEV